MNRSVSGSPPSRARFFTLRALLYLLPGLAAALGALFALIATGRVTATLVGLTAALVVLGFAVPPIVDWLRGRYAKQMSHVRSATLRRQRQAEKAAAQLRDHFEPLGRGVLPSSVRTGSYFTGRVRVISELTDWFGNSTSDVRARLVIGAPGSGKSAVLGRLILLANQQTGDEKPGDTGAVPPETAPLRGVIILAVHARGRTVDEVAAEVAAALTIDRSSAVGLIAALRDAWQPRPVVVLVDAVDEATDPYRLIVELLEPLASASERTKIRLLVGTRRGGDDGLVRLFGASAVVVDLDSPEHLGRHDVEEYAYRVLTAEEDPQVTTPYRDRPELAQVVARAVAAKAGKSFLVAQLSALSLIAADEVLDTNAGGWVESLPATVGAAMERYLREVRPGGRWLRDLLMALAWSQGDGLDDLQVWAAAATALGTAEYSERDVARLLLDTSAVDLLHRTARGERIAFRLFHEALAEYLRREGRQYRPVAETQRRLTDILVAHVPRTATGKWDWAHADGYTRTHLPFHAAQGRALDPLLADAGFLATAEPGRLLAALPEATTDRGRQIAQTVERVGQQLLQAPPDEQVCYLEMAARMASDDLLAKELAEFAPQRPWSVPWAHWEPLGQGRLLGHHDDWVVAVGAVEGKHGVTVVSASAWAIRAWSLADGSPLPSGLLGPPSPIVDMVAFAEADDIVVLTLHENGDLCRTTLGAAFLPRTLARDLKPYGLWLTSHGGQPAAITINRDHMVEVLSAADGHPLGLPTINIGEGWLLAATSSGRRALCVVATPDDSTGRGANEVALWDLSTGTMLGSSFRQERHFPDRPARSVWAAAMTERGGHPVVLLGSEGGGPVCMWDPTQDQVIGEEHFGLAVFSALIVHAGDGELQCWGDSNGNLHLRSGDSRPVGRIAAHDGGIQVMAACDLDGKPLVITGGRDGVVRAWNPGVASPSRSPTGTERLVVVPPADGRGTMIASIRQDDIAPVLDAASGQILGRLMPMPGAHIREIALLPGPTTAVLALDSRNNVAVWRPPYEQPEFTWKLPKDIEVNDIAVAKQGHPMLLVAQADGYLAFFDIASGQPIRAPLNCNNSAARFTVAADSAQSVGDVQFITATRAGDVKEWTITGDKITLRTLPIAADPKWGQSSGIYALTFARMDSRQVIVGVGGGSRLHAWDAHDGSLIAHTRLEQAHRMALHDVDVGEIAGRAIVLCGGYTCTLALWPFDTRDEHHLRVGSPLWSVKSLPSSRAVVAGPRGIMAFQLTAHLPGKRTATDTVPNLPMRS